MSGRRRVDVRGAAEALGISAEAVRKRLHRGTLEHEKDADGRVVVLLDGDGTATGRREDDRPDGVLLEVLRDEIAHLRRESERKDAIIMQMAQANASLASRVPELEAPQGDQEDAREPRHGAGGVVEDGEHGTEPQRASWWVRWFGG